MAMNDISEIVRDHDRRIVELEKDSREFMVRLEHLVKQLEHLNSWLKALVVSIIGVGGGFIIWYIQSLPR